MSDVNANIGVSIDTSQALAQLKNLQREISQFHTSIAKSSATAAAAQSALQKNFVNSLNATGKFAAEIKTIKTTSESFTSSLEKNKFSMGEYFKYAAASTKTFGRLFKNEYDTIGKVAEDRVKKLQTQYIKMGRDANGALKAIAVTPLALDMNNLQTKTMLAAQKQQLFNELLSKGSTNLINFGKNTQWAGRQLMVGFTIPLTIFGSQATRVFLDIEQQALRFKRVYGDLFTSTTETNANLTAVRGLAQEYVKYGIAVKDTMSLAADAAAAGFQGAKLQETVRQATKLSVLGEVDKQQAFKATISLQSAFVMSNEELAESVDFLNAVENQSVTSLQDMTDAIPKVAPIIRGLGGDVKDMAVFLTAMKEGGVNAAEGANGLKSALASMINPSKAAKEMLAGVGISLEEITTRNKGNLMRTVIELGDALKGLEPMARTQVLEKLFGKYQFARVSALFDNISKTGSQAQRTMELMSMSATDLARISNKELTSIEENAATKFKAAVEGLKTAIAPVGAVFISVITPILELITKLADKFSGLSDHTKKIIAVIITVIGGVAPVVLMLVGLFANFFGQIMKFFALLKGGFNSLTGGSKILGEQTNYLTSAQIEASAVAASLDQIHSKLTQRFTVEASAVNALRTAYLNASAAASTFTMANPNMLIAGRGRKKYADGVVTVPGTGSGDTVPAMLTPGEAVIPAKMAKRYAGLINAMVSGNIPGYEMGKGFKNATMFLPESMNTKMGQAGGPGVPMGQVLEYVKSASDAAMGPLMAVMAKEMGLKLNDPKFKSEWVNIGKQLSATVHDSLASSGRTMVTDDTFEEIVVPALRQKAKALQVAGKEIGTAMNNAIDQVRTVGPVGVGSGSASEGKPGSGGRTAFAGSYRNARKVAQEYAIERNPDMFQRKDIVSSRTGEAKPKFQTFDPTLKKWEVGTMAHITKSITASAENLIKKVTPYLGNVGARITKAISKSAVDGMAQEAQVASLSKKARKIGQETTGGAIAGMKDESKKARAAGRIIATQATTGIMEGGIAGGGHGGNGPVDLGMPGMGPPKGPGKISALKTRLRGMSPGGAMMGMSGAVLGASMMPGPVGDFAQKLVPATMGLQAFATMLPLLTNPIGATVAALGGLAFLLYKTNKAYEAHVQAIKDSAKAEVARTYGSMSAVQGYADFNKIPLSSSRQFNRVGDARYISADSVKQQGAMEYYKSKEGKISNTAITQAKDKESAIAMDIGKRAAIFNLSPQDIAANIKAAAELAGGANEVTIQAKLQEMLAPNGKDILKEPLTLEAKIEFLKSDTVKQLDFLKTQIGKIGIPAIDPTRAFSGTAGRGAGAGGGAVIMANRDKLTRDSAVASELAKNAMLEQREALAKLNAAYVDGTITEKEYNAEHAKMMAGFQGIGSSVSDLINRMDEVDKSGKASKALLSDLADSVLADFTKTNKATSKLVKDTLADFPDKIQTELLIGLSKGSLQPTDIIQINDLLAGMNGKTIQQQYDLVTKVSGTDSLKAYLRLLIITREYQEALAKGFSSHNSKQAMDNLKKQAEEAVAAADKVNPTKSTKTGTTGLNNNGGDKKTETSFLDAVVKKLRDTYFANQKLTEGFAASKKAIEGMFGKALNMSNGLESKLKAMGAGPQLSDLLLGLSPTEFKANQELFFTFTDKTKTKIKDLSEWAKKLNELLRLEPLANYFKEQKQKLTDMSNKAIVLNKLLASGISYEQALSQLQGMPSEILAEFANTDMATKNWKELLNIIKEVNNVMNMTPEAQAQYIGSVADKALSMIDAQAAVIKAKANAGVLENPNAPGTFINLTQDQAAIDAAQEKVQEAQNLIDAQQKLIDQNNHLIDQAQHQIDLIDQQVSAKEKELEAQQKIIDTNYDKPLQQLQEEGNILSNNLSIIEHQAKAVNEAYDAQAKALEEVNKLNEDSINQNKAKLSIADALSSGDIAAAAKAVDELHAQQAAAQARTQQDALDKARKQAIDGLTAGGMTKAQIEERQYQISQQSFKLEQDKAAYIKLNVIPLEEAIKKLQEEKIPFQERINQLQADNYLKQQEIYQIEQDKLVPANAALKAAQDKYDTDQKIVEELIKQLDYNKQNKEQWELVKAEANLTYLKIVSITDQIWSAVAAANALAAALAAAQAASLAASTTSTTSAYTGSTDLAALQAAADAAALAASQNTGNGADALYDQNAAAKAAADLAAAKAAQQSTTAYDPLNPSHLGSYSDGVNAIGPIGPVVLKAMGYWADGGFIPKGTDTVPAMLTPGEFVVNKQATRDNLPLLHAMNGGKGTKGSNYAEGGQVEETTTFLNFNAATGNTSPTAGTGTTTNTGVSTSSNEPGTPASPEKKIENEKILLEIKKQIETVLKSILEIEKQIKISISAQVQATTQLQAILKTITPIFILINAQLKIQKDYILALLDINVGYPKVFDWVSQILQKLKDANTELKLSVDAFKEMIIQNEILYKAIGEQLITATKLANEAMSNLLGIVSGIAAQAASALASIMALNVTVVTTHVIHTVYTSEGTPPPGAPTTPPPGSTTTVASSSGGFVPKYLAIGGRTDGFKPLGTDTIPAMLTPGEFVVNKRAAQTYGFTLAKMNSMSYPKDGMSAKMPQRIQNPQMSSPIQRQGVKTTAGRNNVSIDSSNPVYNYQVGVHLSGSNIDANEVANVVLRKIQEVESQVIRTRGIK